MWDILSQRLLEPNLIGIRKPIIPEGLIFSRTRKSQTSFDLRICCVGIVLSLVTLDQRIIWQRWMIRTRIVDEHLKELFTNGLGLQWRRFTGKGFRSTWQGVVACASAMSRAIDLPESELILLMSLRQLRYRFGNGDGTDSYRSICGQMGKAESYMDGGNPGSGGRDLHIGNWGKRVLPPTAPLPTASATTTGIALAAQKLGKSRFHLAPVGEGCSSSGEFWEAMNLAGTRGLPICYMIQNNQIALDTFILGQSGAETFGDKGISMGIPSWTLDGSDPAQFYASTSVAREIALWRGFDIDSCRDYERMWACSPS